MSNEISIVHGAELVYDPKMATVTNGTNMSWLNNDIIAHTATARHASFDTGIVERGRFQICYSKWSRNCARTIALFIRGWKHHCKLSRSQNATSAIPSVTQGIAQKDVTFNNLTQG